MKIMPAVPKANAFTGDFIPFVPPTEILDRQAAFANGEEIPDWHDFLEQFTPEDGLEDVSPCHGCSGCTFR